MKPCLTCGAPSESTRCAEHTVAREHELTREQRGYDYRWRKLADRAKRIQPWCSDCYTTADLTVDHSERAWRRRAAGKAIRLRDVEVVCRSCNSKRGAVRVGATRGGSPSPDASTPGGKSRSPSHTPRGYA